MNREILVYDDGEEPEFFGILYVQNVNGREVFAFEYAKEWLSQHGQSLSYDPDLQFYAGRQYVLPGKPNFGCFADAAPDRWGRKLLQRRESFLARRERRYPKKLLESDYLLGVYDAARIGSWRFKLAKDSRFLADDEFLATPPWVALRQLEQSSWIFENGTGGEDTQWLDLLLAPGSSLGGARPKATVQDASGNLWIAKFPSRHDEYDSGAWEMVVHDLAVLVNLRVPEGKLVKFSERGSTFLVRRFDRIGAKRVHYASAMTMLGKTDGDTETSYLDLARFIVSSRKTPPFCGLGKGAVF